MRSLRCGSQATIELKKTRRPKQNRNNAKASLHSRLLFSLSDDLAPSPPLTTGFKVVLQL